MRVIAVLALCSAAMAETAPVAAETPAPLAPAPAPTTSDAPAESGGGSWGDAFGGTLGLRVGYDSNALLEPDPSPAATDSDGVAWGVDASGTLRLIDRRGRGLWAEGPRSRRLALTASAAYRAYPGRDEANLTRVGLRLAGHERRSFADPGAVITFHHYILDGETVADAVGAHVFASKIAGGHRAVDAVFLGGEYIVYADDDDKSGILGTLAWRHWFLASARDIKRRIEIGLALDVYAANAEWASWIGPRPHVGVAWRFGHGERLGTVDTAAALTYEWRRYGEYAGDNETQNIVALEGGADAWLCGWATAGVFAGYGRRDSSLVVNDYDRWQAGVRAGASF